MERLTLLGVEVALIAIEGLHKFIRQTTSQDVIPYRNPRMQDFYWQQENVHIDVPLVYWGIIGLEWFYRLFGEPKGLWRRYLVDPFGLIPVAL